MTPDYNNRMSFEEFTTHHFVLSYRPYWPMVEQLERGEQRQAQFTKKLGQTKALYDELKYTCAEQTEQNAVLL